jgi:phosphatidylglycerol lysyltransferase
MKIQLRKYAGPLCSLILFTAALWILGQEVRTVHLQNILSEVDAIPEKRFWLAVVLTALSYTLMTGYDFFAIRFVKHTLPIGKIALASFLGYAFSNNIGLSMLAGASVRYRLYSNWRGWSAKSREAWVSLKPRYWFWCPEPRHQASCWVRWPSIGSSIIWRP